MLFVVTLEAESERLDEYEKWARERLTPVIGPMRVVDRRGGPGLGLHDFEVDLGDGLIAAIEVTGEVDGERRSLASQAERQFASFTLPGSRWLWRVGLAATVRVNAIKKDELRLLLSDMEATGTRNARHLGDYRDPLVARLKALGIESVHALDAGVGQQGTVMVGAGSYGAFGWDRRATDAWLRELFASDRGINKVAKLGRAAASERHLVVVLDSFSQAGMGIPLGLRAARERGPADYGTPSLIPPGPLTHLWLIPEAIETWDGLSWSRVTGWTVFPAWRATSPRP